MLNTQQSTEYKYEYPIEFRQQIIALMLKPGWLNSFRETVSAEYFPTQIERDVVYAVLQHYDTYRNIPTAADLCVDIPQHSELIYAIYELKSHALSRTEYEVIEWAKSQALKIAIMDCIDDIQAGDLTQIRDRVIQALAVGADQTDNGSLLVTGTKSWLSRSFGENVVPTPWRPANVVLNGGLAGGELGIILAPPNSYKTTTLINIGTTAANIANGKNVLHFTLEMDEPKVLRRYAARITNLEYKYDNYDEDTYIQLLGEHSRQKLRGEVLVKRYLANHAKVSTLRDFTLRCKDNGFFPELIIVDYPDLLAPSRKRREKREELGEIYVDLRAFAGELNIPVWGASQATRGSFNKEIITMADIAEDISKAATADCVFAVCQTRKEAAAHNARIYMAKVRDGESKGEVYLKIRYPAMIAIHPDEIPKEVINDNE